MDENTGTTSRVDSLDRLLQKYGKIWIWSILLAFCASDFIRTAWGLSNLPLLGNRQLMNSGPAFAIWTLAIAGFLESIAIFLALFWLFQFMIGDILPIFFPSEDAEAVPGGGQLLYRAFASLLVAIGIQISAHLIGILQQIRS